MVLPSLPTLPPQTVSVPQASAGMNPLYIIGGIALIAGAAFYFTKSGSGKEWAKIARSKASKAVKKYRKSKGKRR
jgi:hypothetical protein